jgi:hypothetical protein
MDMDLGILFLPLAEGNFILFQTNCGFFKALSIEAVQNWAPQRSSTTSHREAKWLLALLDVSALGELLKSTFSQRNLFIIGTRASWCQLAQSSLYNIQQIKLLLCKID